MAEMRRDLEKPVRADQMETVHPVRGLTDHHFHLDGISSSDGGLWLVMICALLFVPYMMAVLFYPVPLLIAGGIVAALSFAAYEGTLFWNRRRARS